MNVRHRGSSGRWRGSKSVAVGGSVRGRKGAVKKQENTVSRKFKPSVKETPGYLIIFSNQVVFCTYGADCAAAGGASSRKSKSKDCPAWLIWGWFPDAAAAFAFSAFSFKEFLIASCKYASSCSREMCDPKSIAMKKC